MPVERRQCPVGVPLGGHRPEKEDDQTFIDLPYREFNNWLVGIVLFIMALTADKINENDKEHRLAHDVALAIS